MLKSPLFLFLICRCLALRAQTPDSLILELKVISNKIAGGKCQLGTGDLISNRAMNIFLSDKVGSYLSESDNLTLYKNSVNFDAAEGTFGLNHNLYSVKGADDPVRSLPTIGVKANVADAFAARYAGRQYNNKFGFFFKQTWIAKTTTHFNPCTSDANANHSSSGQNSQKLIMDAWRAGILHTLEAEIIKRTADFETALGSVDSSLELPGQDVQKAKATARSKFYADLKEEFEYKYADQQSAAMAENFVYNSVVTNWTSVSAYLPLIEEKFEVAPAPGGSIHNRHAYPLKINASHTRFWEDSRLGRFFLTVSGSLYWNNSVEASSLPSSTFADYRNNGGVDSLSGSQLSTNRIYIGDYDDFFTPQITGQLIFFPRTSHFGISFLAEQNFGIYHALNGKIGVPIVLINKKAEPAITFEFQVRFFDITRQIAAGKGLGERTSIGLSVGIPFSRIAY